MAAKHKVTVSTRPTDSRGTAAERRAAQTEWLSTQQAVLKQEAAERRAQRAAEDTSAVSIPPRAAAAERSN